MTASDAVTPKAVEAAHQTGQACVTYTKCEHETEDECVAEMLIAAAPHLHAHCHGEALPEFTCPACGATTRARMADCGDEHVPAGALREVLQGLDVRAHLADLDHRDQTARTIRGIISTVQTLLPEVRSDG